MLSDWQRLVKCSSNLHPFVGCPDGMYFQLGGSCGWVLAKQMEVGVTSPTQEPGLWGPGAQGRTPGASKMVESSVIRVKVPETPHGADHHIPLPHPMRQRWLTNNTCIKMLPVETQKCLHNLPVSHIQIHRPFLIWTWFQNYTCVCFLGIFHVNLKKSLKVCYNYDYQLL